MLLYFNQTLAEGYHSTSQKIRVMSENWLYHNVYCVKCGKDLNHFENNKPVADFYCENCKEEFELKSSKSKLGKIIVDGAYKTMMEKIENNSMPNFFYLNYNVNSCSVDNLVVIPKHYFTKEIIIKRRPLPITARRAGWVGCNIDVSSIPMSGKLFLVRNGQWQDKTNIVNSFNKMLFLREQTLDLKGWLLDVMNCIEFLKKQNFTLNEIYSFETYLKLKHPSNNNVKAKIRQQLQILRDFGYLKFVDKGEYELL